MKTVLSNIETKLEADLNYIKKVAIVPHELLIPNTAGFPAIGIMDSGDVIHRFQSQVTRKMTVSIVVYQKILEDRAASVMGGQSEKGVLEITDDIWAALKEEYFDRYVNLVKYLGSSATRAFTTEYNDFIAFKICRFEYHKIYIES